MGWDPAVCVNGLRHINEGNATYTSVAMKSDGLNRHLDWFKEVGVE